MEDDVPVKAYIGLDNYTNLLGNDDRFINALERTAIISTSALALEFGFGFVMALLFWRTFHRVRGLATLILLPMLISPVVVGFTARMAFTDSYGFVNQVLSVLWPGGDVSLNWLSSPTLAPLVVIFADAWQWGPFSVSPVACGAPFDEFGPDRGGARRRCPRRAGFRYIVLPAMRYVIIVALVLRGLDLLRMFDVVALATRGGPGIATETLTYYIYNLAFSFFDLGYAAAASVLMLLGVSVLVGVAVRSLVRGAAA